MHVFSEEAGSGRQRRALRVNNWRLIRSPLLQPMCFVHLPIYVHLTQRNAAHHQPIDEPGLFSPSPH